MIVRISTEGQYRLDDALLPQLNALDNQLVAAVTAGKIGRASCRERV